MITIRSASLAFGDHLLFSGLDLDVGPGQLVGVSGESGCGKTSLLRAILGFVPLTEGTMEVCGMPMDVQHIHEIRRQTAYVPQELQPPAETGRDLLSLTRELSYNKALATPFNNILTSLALDSSLLTLPASKLSGGQRQRLLLAAALSIPKPLLLLDEPTSALDEESSHRVALLLQSACHNDHRAALVVSHDPVLLASCDHLITPK